MSIFATNATKPSILQNIQLNETVNTDILNRLINSNLLKLTKNERFNCQFDNEKLQLLEIAKHVKNSILTTKYAMATYNVGRVFAHKSLSLGCLRKAIRHTLCYDVYTDIDIENCHPQLLLQYCEANNILTNCLKQYVNDRTKILQETQAYYNVNRDDAKLLFIILMYYGSFDNWVIEVKAEKITPTGFIKNYIKELKNIGVQIASSNTDLVKIVQKLNKTNSQSSIVSLFLQDIERQILELIYDYLTSHNYIQHKNCILCFDGIMIERKYFKPEIINELHKYILEESGYNLTFTTKALDNHLLNELPNIPIDNSYEFQKVEFEKKVCKISEGVLYAILKNDNTYSFITHEACLKRFCQLKFIENG